MLQLEVELQGPRSYEDGSAFPRAHNVRHGLCNLWQGPAAQKCVLGWRDTERTTLELRPFEGSRNAAPGGVHYQGCSCVPLWKDNSTPAQCSVVEKAVGGATGLAALTGIYDFVDVTGRFLNCYWLRCFGGVFLLVRVLQGSYCG